MYAIIQTGGRAKWYLRQTPVLVNHDSENRRGRKLYPGDRIQVKNVGLFVIRKKPA